MKEITAFNRTANMSSRAPLSVHVGGGVCAAEVPLFLSLEGGVTKHVKCDF